MNVIFRSALAMKLLSMALFSAPRVGMPRVENEHPHQMWRRGLVPSNYGLKNGPRKGRR